MSLKKEKKDFIVDKKDRFSSLRKLISVYIAGYVSNKSGDDGHCVQGQDRDMQWVIEIVYKPGVFPLKSNLNTPIICRTIAKALRKNLWLNLFILFPQD